MKRQIEKKELNKLNHSLSKENDGKIDKCKNRQRDSWKDIQKHR